MFPECAPDDLRGDLRTTGADELRAEVFESDEELDEFLADLADLAEFRHRHMA